MTDEDWKRKGESGEGSDEWNKLIGKKTQVSDEAWEAAGRLGTQPEKIGSDEDYGLLLSMKVSAEDR